MNKLIQFISRNRFIHNLASYFVIKLPLFILHNFSKYFSIRKILYSINIDNIKGDYCEFGCFTGASLNHALNTHRNYMKSRKMQFYGFDSFQGFPVEVHKEFKSKNFKSDYRIVRKLEKKFDNCKVVKGFFEDSLNDENIKSSIQKISFAFIDCDIAPSSKKVFEFIKPRLSNGAYIMIDDFYNLDKNGENIHKIFREYFDINKDVFTHSYFGNEGVIFRFFKKDE